MMNIADKETAQLYPICNLSKHKDLFALESKIESTSQNNQPIVQKMHNTKMLMG